jgi:hypothetical protein
MAIRRIVPASRADTEQAFDLNIEKVLEHWTVPFAIRELIANALDEQALTGTADPAIFKDEDGLWHIADSGRGLRYEHLTQKEDAEKRRHPDVIGQFGMGLKDALAVFDRRGIRVMIRSPHADITTGRRPKEAFPDVVTLHALVSAPSEPGRVGTDISLAGVRDDDVEAARRFFLRYSGERLLESTEHGDVLARPDRGRQARIYVKGLLVAEEPNFLFSYNITKLSASLRRALNRERSKRRPRRLFRPGQGHPHGLPVHRGSRPARRRPERLRDGTAARRAWLARRGPARLPRAPDQREGHLRHRLADGREHRPAAVRARRRLPDHRGTRGHRTLPGQPHRPQRQAAGRS